ncbi:PREDICTED: uncharacterized protein LOC107064640 [Polistes dominula]|uniref:Uncharacterized protein LOC107064640 n=1 Tax=Polistes dominula TaxID=743375 RepID=A0ABM1HYI8_POLDO|nr:PREDICTED: uncharacterized protein LOC107064640 [Polistes dominula]
MDQTLKKDKSVTEMEREKKQELSNKLKQLDECDEVVSVETINAIGRVTEDVVAADDNPPSSDELDENLEEEYQNLNDILDLPDDTYSLTAIKPELPACVKYGVRSGLTHLNMSKFSPLSRGHQGGAIAITAFATTAVYKSRCWNESVIDQIIEDGDTFYCESYADINTDDRRRLSILDLKRNVFVQNKLNVNVTIKDPSYAGKFHSQDPTELHLVKALELFFKRHNSGILTSSILNLAIWKEPRYFNIFDGQARKETCEPAKDGEDGSAKLFLVKDLIGVYFIILEKSNVKNESFVLYPISISGVETFSSADDPDEPEKSLGKPQRRPSGYKIQEKFRAVVQGSYHLMHPVIPELLRGRGHLIIALAAIVYSCLVSGNKWTTALIDLIFNQSNIYLIDLVRVLDKNLEDEEFELRLEDVMGDIILGVYSAKIKLHPNVIPGHGKKKKGKLAIDSGIREFFETQTAGILDIKKFFYAIWKEDNTYYFMDPFACDEEGFRINYGEERQKVYGTRDAACVTMNSSINQLVETILENTLSKERDPFLIHGIKVLYVKTGMIQDGPFEKVIYRDRGTNRRPFASLTQLSKETVEKKLDMTPKIRLEYDEFLDAETQFPDLMRNINQYMFTDDEEEEEEEEDKSILDSKIKQITGYNVINPHRLIVQGTKNCLHPDYKARYKGRQGLIVALVALAYRKLKNPSTWRNIDLDQIIDIGNKTYEDVIDWIKEGKPKLKGDREEEEEEEEEEVEEEEEEEDEDEESERILKMLPTPSHLDLSMLPVKLKFAENEVMFKTRMNLLIGEAHPLANLAEALECYFAKYTELVLENNKLMYGIWKDNDKYFLFNPYGSDEEGWRLLNYPASFAVVDTLNELTDVLYGILEYNNNDFIIHFVALDSIQPGKYAVSEPIEIPDDTMVKKFQTKFLPITDEDLLQLEKDDKPILTEIPFERDITEEEDEEEEEEEDEGDEEDKVETHLKALEEAEKKPIISPLLIIEEKDQPDAPNRLNLALLTGSVKVQTDVELIQKIVHPERILEKLKYTHPPPYVMPPKATLGILLDAKRAKRSVHSLVSRFSIDSRLEVKKKIGLSEMHSQNKSIILSVSEKEVKPAKMIKLNNSRYLYSRVLPIYLMPLRAINDRYIQNVDLEKDNSFICKDQGDSFDLEQIPEIPTGIRIMPELLPLGPIIKTPTYVKKSIFCIEKKKRKCLLSKMEKEEPITKKIICDTENVLLEMMFPNFQAFHQEDKIHKPQIDVEDKIEMKTVQNTKDQKEKVLFEKKDEGFKVVNDNIAILRSNMRLENRAEIESCHFKACYYAAMLCLLGKIRLNIDHFRGINLDEFIYMANKIYQRVGKLRYKPLRWFHNFEILDTKYTVIMKQSVYADPENCEADKLKNAMETFMTNNESGILVTSNISYGFWKDNDRYYLFDPYACDENGKSNEEGYACLMEFCDDLSSMLERIEENAGGTTDQPYRLYTMFISHMETKKDRKRKKKKKKKTQYCIEKVKEEVPQEESADLEEEEEVRKSDSETSLIESTEWIIAERKLDVVHDMTKPGFSPIRYYDASMLDVIVLEDEITRPLLAPFKTNIERFMNENRDPSELMKLMIRRKPYDRKFKEHVSVITPIDLCIMAWSLIHDPVLWSVRIIRGLFEASCDYTFDSILATEDSTVSNMSDGLLLEFEIANYVFRPVFVPLHYGTLYAIEGWNLAMSLKYVFDSPAYTGAIIVCEDSHIGVTKTNDNYFAWWVIKKTKILRIITSTNIKEFLRIIIKEINQTEEIQFIMRVVTISYAKKLDPDCTDVKGLHEFVLPTTSLAEIHKMEAEPYDLEAIFKPTVPETKPIFIMGTVALSDRETVKEPRVKRCYFVAILAVMFKRDIIQSPLPGMIDKIIEVAESLYREYHEPKFHTEHILRNVTLMNRIFDLRDCASCLVPFTIDPRTERNDFYIQVRKYLKKHFVKYSSGIIQFSNCCYGFWYSRSTNSYYYLDPYQCNDNGRKVLTNGVACLCIFSSICQMVKNMCFNQMEESTGFFIHRLHVDSVNVSPSIEFQEDPMWIYLDYHWTFDHAPEIIKSDKKLTKKRQKKKRYNNEEEKEKQMKIYWNNYVIEVTDLIYSIWGTIGCYDSKFGNRAGKNQAAICVAVLAMQYLSHPSRWNSAVLDSAVICGDSYYTESLKSSIKKCSKHSNRYNLQPCFRIFPHVWTINFSEPICGILYGGRNRLTLANALKSAFDDAPNILIECNKITLGALLSKDGYYVGDPCWVGPPLFNKDRGAIYVLRCKNLNSFVYAVTKILNTNQRLEFRITPVIFTFEQENFKLSSKGHVARRKILLEPLQTIPGKVEGYDVSIPGGQTVTEVDSYLWYSRKLGLGVEKAHELENPQLPSLAPQLKKENLNSMLVSTTWHLNLGQSKRIKKSSPLLFDLKSLQHVSEECEKNMVATFEAHYPPKMSISDRLKVCDDYPNEIDFMSRHLSKSTIIRKIDPDSSVGTSIISKPLDCSKPRSFILDDTRIEFNKLTADMADEMYKTYQHRDIRRDIPRDIPRDEKEDIVEDDFLKENDFEDETDEGTIYHEDEEESDTTLMDETITDDDE